MCFSLDGDGFIYGFDLHADRHNELNIVIENEYLVNEVFEV